jgi:hypothetical protein
MALKKIGDQKVGDLRKKIAASGIISEKARSLDDR